MASVETNLFDEEEVHENCRVTIWRNSKTGEESIGWQPEKHGKWIYFNNGMDVYKCSECGSYVPFGFDKYTCTGVWKAKYCPYCGSRNRLDGDSDV